jgi:hypothetical protein
MKPAPVIHRKLNFNKFFVMKKPVLPGETVLCFMIFRYTCFTVLFILLFYCADAQHQFLQGKIFHAQTDEVLLEVDVHNLSTDLHRQSDLGGNFKITAKPGDRILFSLVGYLPDTIRVTSYMIDSGYDVRLLESTKELPTISVSGDWNKYQLDSIKRREDYRYVYEKNTTKLIGRNNGYTNTPTNGVGLSLSPVTYFSKQEKQLKALKKRLQKNEETYYVDYRFSRSYVAKLTRLEGDSLDLFMKRYEPSYSYCRKTSPDDMMLYINECLKKFQKHS